MAPLSSDVVPLCIFINDQQKVITRDNINAIIFSSPDADFKQDLSFYYPVWDKSKNNQICIKCKPSLYTYLKIKDNGTVSSAVIQFSGRDFGQYMYYPQIIQKPGNNFFILSTPQTSPYVFNFLTSISQTEISTDRRIVLDSINSNLPFSSDVPVDYYIKNPYYILDSNNIIRRQVLMLDNSIFDIVNIAPKSVNLGQIQLSELEIEVNVLQDDWISFDYDGQELTPDSSVQFNISNTNNSYTNYTRKDNSNWFSGKSYFYDGIQLLVQGQVKITSVKLINGKQVIFTDSITSITIPKTRNSNNDPTILQIYSTQDTLELNFDTSLEKQTVIVDSICDSRITNLIFPVTSNVTTDIQALPIIVFTKYRNLL